MKIFLKEIIKNVQAEYSSELHNISLIFPNKRPGVFAVKYLSEIIDKPQWMPKIYTVNELMYHCSDYKLADDILLISKLYKIFKTITKTSESFDQFYFWGELLLSDFNDIDKYLVNAEDIFRNLSSVKEIEDKFEYLDSKQLEAISHFWSNFDKGKLSEQKEKFIKVWSKLYNIYISFKKHLSAEEIAYEGMIYRDIVDRISNEKQIKNLPDKMIFIGFNALNKCEERLFDYLQKTKKAVFYWDYDQLYINNNIHEAGRFIRKNLNQFPPNKLDIQFDILKSTNKKINVVSVPSEIAQTKVCFDILNRIPAEEYHETVVVLADEHLLLPMLYSIPQQIKELNITMGYPLKDTPIFSLVNNIIELQKNIKQNKDNQTFFYYKLVLNILNHQYITHSNEVLVIANEIHKHNKIYVSKNDFEKSDLLKLIFKPVEKSENIGEYLLDILYELNKGFLKNNEQNNENIEQEYIYCLYKLINRLNEVLNSLEHKFSIEIYLKLLSQYIQNQSVSFEGEPLLGLQIMGLLETRVLDFKNVIILSMNEGILPSVTSAPSFIPYNIRKGFDMQTIEYKDSIYAYTFYRLIQRAENVHLIYSNISSGLTIGEKSRYINQMLYDNRFNLSEQTSGFDIDVEIGKTITIKKDKRILDILKNYYKGGKRKLSPSAINTYLNCSLQFYYRYIADIKEVETISEEIDGMLFGNMYHSCMFKLYKDFQDELISAIDIENILKNKSIIEKTIENAFRNDYFNIKNENSPVEITGKNILIFDILKKYIIQTLKNDLRYAPFTIVALEKEYNSHIAIETEQEPILINVYGKIDRIDSKEGIVRVIDYKTGKANLIFKGLAELFSDEPKERNSAVMQTFLYSHLFSKENPEYNFTIIPGIFVLKDIFSQSFNYLIKETVAHRKYSVIEDFRTIETKFAENLINIINEIFNKDIAFSQTNEPDNCKYCPYVGICGR